MDSLVSRTKKIVKQRSLFSVIVWKIVCKMISNENKIKHHVLFAQHSNDQIWSCWAMLAKESCVHLDRLYCTKSKSENQNQYGKQTRVRANTLPISTLLLFVVCSCDTWLNWILCVTLKCTAVMFNVDRWFSFFISSSKNIHRFSTSTKQPLSIITISFADLRDLFERPKLFSSLLLSSAFLYLHFYAVLYFRYSSVSMCEC